MSDDPDIYDIAVIGAGAAGCMAAIWAGQAKKQVILLERNDFLCRKVLLTSNGRCNLTNNAPCAEFIKKFSPNGEFYRTAFYRFSNQDLLDFFRAKGLEFKVEDRGRVLPVTNKAGSVVAVLEECLKENGVKVCFGRRITAVEPKEDIFVLIDQDKVCLTAKKVIIATGGVSYQVTGSTGDGLDMAKRLGHGITELTPGLVPLKVKESLVKDLQGLSFDNVRIAFHEGSKKITSESGELLFTHFGLSGPLVLDTSARVSKLLAKQKEVELTIDFMPDIKRPDLEKNLLERFSRNGRAKVKNVLSEMVPGRMAPVFLVHLGILPEKIASQVGRKERETIAGGFKAFALTVNDGFPIDAAMVTCGGVDLKEIDPRTMGSRIVPGLYFAGEVIESAGSSGGYNLQQAFSTGYLAAQASLGVKNG
jgi:predicted Rossmann fold flavoprotein